VLNFLNGDVDKKVDVGCAAFRCKHIGDVTACAVAEKLAQSFFVIRNSMVLHQRDEIGGCVASQRGFGKVGIRGDKVFRLAMKIGEVAAPAAGDQDFFASTRGSLKDGNAPAALPCFNGAQQASGTSAENYGIIVVSHF
jgi:hypothetical protein